ncbi:hypothetical protein ABT013_33520 [Streptomyces bacillaris]|uniref:hypothetical protein n=1 Tax=Streptomyces TaxID=1883 RepID=UPI000F78B63A|nr:MULTISPECIES: hypothetical protein [unclassified Streptomyces]RST14715.1 hypothetical protein EF908_36450 [Streptomyces sp. WAC04770]
MNLLDQYTDHLREFGAAATDGIERVLAEGNYGQLRALDFDEDEQGVFVTIDISLSGEIVQRWGSDAYRRRHLIIQRQDGPIDPADFGAALVHTSVMEDLDTAGRRPPA